MLSANLLEPSDYLEFSAEELVGLCNALSCALAGVEDFIQNASSSDDLHEAKEDFALWKSLSNKIETYLDSLDK